MMRRGLRVFLAAGVLAMPWGAAPVPAAPSGSRPVTIGEEISLPSRILGREIGLRISLPESYAGTAGRYPVLYTFQSVFHHVGGVTAYMPRVNLAPEMIVVSVESYSSSYFSPERLESDPDSGGADRFIRFFDEELFAFIDGRYRTHPYRLAFSGSSGGGFLVYCALSRPDTFHAYIAASPSIDFEGMSRLIPDNVELFVKKAVFGNRFLFMALEDWPDLARTLEKFTADLRRLDPAGLRWEYNHWPEEDHGSLPHRALFQGLRSAFSGWSRLPEEAMVEGLAGIEAHRRKISAWFGVDLGISRGALFHATQQLMGSENLPEAVRVARLLTEMYPDYSLGLRLLGRAQESAGQLDLALDSYEAAYRKAVETSSPHLGVFEGSLEQIREKIKDREDAGKP